MTRTRVRAPAVRSVFPCDEPPTGSGAAAETALYVEWVRAFDGWTPEEHALILQIVEAFRESNPVRRAQAVADWFRVLT